MNRWPRLSTTGTALCWKNSPNALTQSEISELREARRPCPAALLAAYPKRKYLTAKVHLIERHLVFFSGKYGTLGVFGEDGIGSFYPWVNRYRMPTGLICNPTERVMTTNKHLAAKQLANPKKQAKKKQTCSLCRTQRARGRQTRKERGGVWGHAAFPRRVSSWRCH